MFDNGAFVIWLVQVAGNWSLPNWLNMSFVAAAIVGLATQWIFSFFASRQSRRLNARTEADLHRLQDLLGMVRYSLADVNAAYLRLRDEIVDFTRAALEREAGTRAAALVPAAANRVSGAGPLGRDADLPSEVQELVAASGDEGVSIRAIYDSLRPSTLEALLYVMYRLRDEGTAVWNGSRIRWDTRVRLPNRFG